MKVMLRDVVRNRQCMGCGFCQISVREDSKPITVTIGIDADAERYVPTSGLDNVVGEDVLCPGAAMNLPALAQMVYGDAYPADPLVGHHREIVAAYTTDAEDRARAASGGVVPAVLKYLFSHGEIDAAYCVVSGESPGDARGIIIRSVDELHKIHGSVYHPANFGAELPALLESDECFAFVGLPCEVAGLEQLKHRRPDISKRHRFSIGLFCGGINSFGGIAYYLDSWGVPLDDVQSINYRDGAWPGDIRLTRKSDGSSMRIPRIRGNSRWKILRYVIAFQGYWMLERCRICPDQISDFADIAVGDPHLPRFRASGGKGYSALVSRTQRGSELIESMRRDGVLGVEVLSRDELVESQGYTLDNRRQVAMYMWMARRLGMEPPLLQSYDGVEALRRPHHAIYAFIDLMKLRLPKNRFIRIFFLPWQIFEYLFLTFAPQLIIRRLLRLLRNR
jgi:coenzyme F420 hydrogenase subunit beta